MSSRLAATWSVLAQWSVCLAPEDALHYAEYRSMPRLNGVIFAALCAICFTTSTFAQTLSLPLAGFYRTGRYMPVKVDSAGSLNIQGAGVVPTHCSGASNSIIPVLITGTPNELPGAFEALYALGDQEQLIGSTIDQPSSPNSFRVTLDPANPLPGIAVAWECLDRLVMDANSFSRVKAETIAVLLAAGCKIEVVASDPPDSTYRWSKQNDRWILDYSPAGPAGQLFSEAAFSPTLAWAPGKSAALLHQVFLAGLVLTITIFSLLLWRSKYSFVAMLFVIFAASGAIFLWKKTLPSTEDITGSIIIHKGDIDQIDTWLYERGNSTGQRRIAWNGFTHPVFDSPNRMDELKMSLEIAAEDRLAFVYQTVPGKTVAFMHRKIETGNATEGVRLMHDSPMNDLANGLYLTAGSKILGEVNRGNENWPAVAIDAAPR